MTDTLFRRTLVGLFIGMVGIMIIGAYNSLPPTP